MYSVRDQPGLYLQIQASQGYKVRGATSKNQNNYFFSFILSSCRKTWISVLRNKTWNIARTGSTLSYNPTIQKTRTGSIQSRREYTGLKGQPGQLRKILSQINFKKEKVGLGIQLSDRVFA